MHSWGYRVNTVITLAVFLLALLCSLVSISDIFHVPSVNSHIQVVKVNKFRKQLNGNDEVSLTLNISMNVQSAFTWNTKQVFVFVAAEYQSNKNSLNQISLWDHIIEDKEHAKFEKLAVAKYLLIDQGSHLRGKQIKLVLHWYIMPRVGRMIEGEMATTDFQLPDAYM